MSNYDFNGVFSFILKNAQHSISAIAERSEKTNHNY